ncbi:AAA family ATPase [Paracoccus marcusii]|uniref:AAA family ATPase n=1 Tax=Paracoccus marcusii TaxID=59779 RepID=UPI002493C037|nr:AAA family ATPase [Paracoccus marcusii]
MNEEITHLTNLVLKSVSVHGFRGSEKPIEFDLKRDANFLIGRNGTGKTTLINIISDCLLCRYQALMNAPFDYVEISFTSNDKRHRPFLIVKKLYDEDGDVAEINFSFTDYKTKGPSFSHSIKSRLYRRNDDYLGSSMQRRILEQFSKRFRLTWLALNRANGISKPSSETSNDLDSRLEHSLQRLGTFFTRLDTRFAEEMQKFQQDWFMSLLVPAKRTDFFNTASSIDIDEESKQIKEMLSGIGIKPQQYAAKVDRHTQTIRRLSDPHNLDSAEKEPLDYVADNYDISKLHFLVEQWTELQNTKEEVYAAKEKFITIANGMLYKKTISVDAGNKIYVVKKDKVNPKITFADRVRQSRNLASGKISHIDEIKYSDLSSGEKQLLIFLSETALRSESSYIFIADEPELSLHIEWQEKLVSVILELSPQAQVIFATHSPDIVGKYQKNVISMEAFVE